MSKVINWTEKMLEELKITESITKFSKKYNMSYNTAYNKRKTLMSEIISPVVENIKKEEIEENVNSSIISIVPSIILNIDALMEKGTKFYLADVLNEINVLEKSILDIEHIIENQSCDMDDKNLAILAKNIGSLRRKRRLFKNEYSFLNTHRVDCDNFIKFIKEIKNYSKVICDKKYTTRILKEELGEVHITNPLNSELISLREKVKLLESQNNRSEEEIKKILDLEKFRIKQSRKNKREKGQLVSIDSLVLNWKDLFNNSLDNTTKKEILSECYEISKQYSSTQDKEILDFVTWNETLPNYLFSKGYFLRNEA